MRVLMLSMHDNEQYLFEALRAGASGYVLKTAADRDLVEACRAVLRGQPFLYPSGIAVLIRDFLDRARDGEELPGDAAHPARTRSRQARRRGLHLRADRPAPPPLAQDRRTPPRERPRQARHARPRRTHPLRHQTRTRRTLSAHSTGERGLAPRRSRLVSYYSASSIRRSVSPVTPNKRRSGALRSRRSRSSARARTGRSPGADVSAWPASATGRRLCSIGAEPADQLRDRQSRSRAPGGRSMRLRPRFEAALRRRRRARRRALRW